jgi:methylmalonyl-CoA mutase
VIPAQDYDIRFKAGVASIFGPSTPVPYPAVEMMKILLDKE